MNLKNKEEIKEINRLLFAERKEKGTVLDQMEALDNKINVRQELIRVTNQQSNLLNRQINVNISKIVLARTTNRNHARFNAAGRAGGLLSLFGKRRSFGFIWHGRTIDRLAFGLPAFSGTFATPSGIFAAPFGKPSHQPSFLP